MKKLQQIKAQKAVFDFNVEEDFGKSATIGAIIADYAFDKYKAEKAHHVSEITFTKFSQSSIDEGKRQLLSSEKSMVEIRYQRRCDHHLSAAYLCGRHDGLQIPSGSEFPPFLPQDAVSGQL